MSLILSSPLPPPRVTLFLNGPHTLNINTMLRNNYFCLFISALLILRTENLANFVYFGQIRKSLWHEKLIHNPIRESLCSQNFSRTSKFLFSVLLSSAFSTKKLRLFWKFFPFWTKRSRLLYWFFFLSGFCIFSKNIYSRKFMVTKETFFVHSQNFILAKHKNFAYLLLLESFCH